MAQPSGFAVPFLEEVSLRRGERSERRRKESDLDLERRSRKGKADEFFENLKRGAQTLGIDMDQLVERLSSFNPQTGQVGLGGESARNIFTLGSQGLQQAGRIGGRDIVRSDPSRQDQSLNQITDLLQKLGGIGPSAQGGAEVKVRHPNGQIGMIDKKDLEQALKEGFQIIR